MKYYRGLRVGPTGNDAVVEAVSGQPISLSGLRYREAQAHHFPLDQQGNLGETDLFQYTSQSRVNSPAFSPDGQHIMVTEGYFSGASAIFSDYPSDLSLTASLELFPVSAESTSYVVPVGIKNQPMPPAQYSETIRPVLVKQASGRLSSMGFNPIAGFSWTPAID